MSSTSWSRRRLLATSWPLATCRRRKWSRCRETSTGSFVTRARAVEPGKRRLLVGETDGGRALTLVIERAVEPTTWLVVTGWSATAGERKLLRG
jgi:hypothetical protein